MREALNKTKKISTNPTTTRLHKKGSGPLLSDQSQTPIVLTNEGLKGATIIREGRLKPNPFFLTLIVGNKLLQKSIIDSDASTIIIPKQIVEVLNLKYEPVSRGVTQLDGNRVKTMGIIKSLPLTLFAYTSITVTQELVAIDIPPIFSFYLSQDFTAKVDGYLSLDWSHLILRTEHEANLKILSGPLHKEHIADEAMINFESTHMSILGEERKYVELLEDEEVTGERSTDQEVFLNEFIDVDPYGNYHATGLGTYVIFYEDQPIPKVSKDP